MVSPEFETARAAMRERLDDRAFAHSEAVAEAAAALAEAYGVDPAAARLAGLLHDWAREDGEDSLVSQAESSGLAVGSVDALVPYLLHAPVGAEALRDRFPGISDEILSAVRRHTFGAPDMSDLDIVIYVADMIEPARVFEGAEELRSMAGAASLLELYARAYAMTLTHLVAARKHLHPGTVDAWNTIVDRLRDGGDVT